MKRGIWLLAALLLCCTGSNHKPDKPHQGSGSAPDQGSANVKMTSDAGGAFVRGPSVSPAAQLIAWLDKQKRGNEARLVRLPVVLARGGSAYATRGAKIGAAADAVEVFLMDAALGIRLADRARSQCKGAPQCAMWVEGYWRGKQEGSYQLDVTKYVGAIDDLAAASYAEVEGESGN